MLWNFFESSKLFRSTLFDQLSNNGEKNSWLVLNKILFYTHIVIQYFEVYKTYSNTYSTTRLIVGLSSSYLLFCIGRKSNFIQKKLKLPKCSYSKSSSRIQLSLKITSVAKSEKKASFVHVQGALKSKHVDWIWNCR